MDRADGFYWVLCDFNPRPRVAEWGPGHWTNEEGKDLGEGLLRVWWVVGVDVPLKEDGIRVLSERLQAPALA
jgi:hypothetical protein